MSVGSFEGDFLQFQTDTVNAMNSFLSANVSRLLIDLTNNGGKNPVMLILLLVLFTNFTRLMIDRRLRVPWTISSSVPCGFADRLSVSF